MAFLQTIRTKFSWLLLGGVGLAMLAFILTDLMTSGSSIMTRDANTIIEVNGERISAQEFAVAYQERIDNYIAQSGDAGLQRVTRTQLQNLVYDELLKNRLLTGRIEDLGLTMENDELWERILKNPSVQQVQAFRNEAGMFDPNRVRQYLKAIEEQRATNADAATEWDRWLNFEEEIRRTESEQAYFNLIAAGLGSSSLEGKMQAQMEAEKRAMIYLYRPFTAVEDSTIAVSDSEVKSYYKSHLDDYEQVESRNLVYVNIPIEPSQADIDATFDEFNSLLDNKILYNSESGTNDTLFGFLNTDDDSIFVNSNSDQSRFTGRYLFEEELDPEYDSLLLDQPEGFYYGPYVDGDFVKMVKWVDSKEIPDSVKARHILIAYQGALRANEMVSRTREQAQAYADSLYAVVQSNPSNFATYAQQNSDGPSGADGGNLGWFQQGMMTPKFQDFCFSSDAGAIGLVETEFGFHIIEVEEKSETRPAFKLAILDRRIYSSKATEDALYAKAQQLAAAGLQSSEAWTATAQELGLNSRPANNITPSAANIPGIVDSRDLVRWTYEEGRKVGDLEIFEKNNALIILRVEEIREEGVATLDQVRARVEMEVRREKKAEQIRKEFEAARASSIQSWGDALGIASRQASNIAMANPVVTGAGSEPAVVGTLFAMSQGEITGPIVGETGVFVIEMFNLEAASESDGVAQRDQLRVQRTSRARAQAFDAIVDKADIEDRRNIFY